MANFLFIGFIVAVFLSQTADCAPDCVGYCVLEYSLCVNSCYNFACIQYDCDPKAQGCFGKCPGYKRGLPRDTDDRNDLKNRNIYDV